MAGGVCFVSAKHHGLQTLQVPTNLFSRYLLECQPPQQYIYQEGPMFRMAQPKQCNLTLAGSLCPELEAHLTLQFQPETVLPRCSLMGGSTYCGV